MLLDPKRLVNKSKLIVNMEDFNQYVPMPLQQMLVELFGDVAYVFEEAVMLVWLSLTPENTTMDYFESHLGDNCYGVIDAMTADLDEDELPRNRGPHYTNDMTSTLCDFCRAIYSAMYPVIVPFLDCEHFMVAILKAYPIVDRHMVVATEYELIVEINDDPDR